MVCVARAREQRARARMDMTARRGLLLPVVAQPVVLILRARSGTALGATCGKSEGVPCCCHTASVNGPVPGPGPGPVSGCLPALEREVPPSPGLEPMRRRPEALLLGFIMAARLETACEPIVRERSPAAAGPEAPPPIESGPAMCRALASSAALRLSIAVLGPPRGMAAGAPARPGEVSAAAFSAGLPAPDELLSLASAAKKASREDGDCGRE